MRAEEGRQADKHGRSSQQPIASGVSEVMDRKQGGCWRARVRAASLAAKKKKGLPLRSPV
jgi:hypothetical protein